MSYPVTYYCPHCGTHVELEREGYLADRSVTAYPLVGWEYAAPGEALEDADGVRFVCGEETDASRPVRIDGLDADGATESGAPPGCGDPFYLSFVRYEDGEEVEPRPESEHVHLGL